MNKRIAIYLTNPWPENARPDDQHYGEMFEDMLGAKMSNVTFVHFDNVAGDFADDPTEFDAVVITGSSAFVTDTDPWIETLFAQIRMIDAAKTTLFAVCFGHQAVAAALGGKVEHRDIVLGSPEITVTEAKDWMRPATDKMRLFAGNFQQVVEVPESLEVIASHPACPVVMTAKGSHLLTVQFHPEFSASYMHGYVDLISDHITAECALAGRQEIDQGADGAVFADWVAAFLDQ